MPKGGARVRSGPTKDPNALRRDRDHANESLIQLPAEGRDGEVPDWPLSGASSRELELWESEWLRPQAVEWERQGQHLEVAMFVRSVVDAERPGAPSSARTLVRQQMDSLGISKPGMDRNGWTIVSEREVKREARPQGTSSKSRLKVVKDESA